MPARTSFKTSSNPDGRRWQRASAWIGGRVGRKWNRSYRLRILIQSGFALTCIALGVQFSRFVEAAEAGVTVLPVRPSGVEGFLPIGGLLGAVDWLHQGHLNAIHPAATVLLLTFLAIALFVRKSFCSWLCPVGFLSDLLARLGRRIFGHNFRIWRWLDVLLRGFKYLILGFFVWVIGQMSAATVHGFIESPYYRLSDVRMGLFFLHMGGIAVVVVTLLVVGSVLYRGFWCRYLCPYGALLGLFSWFSPMKVRRDPVSCIDCKLCDKACGARLHVSQISAVASPECTGCLDCVAVCPVQDALGIGLPRRRVPVPVYAMAILTLFFAGYFGAQANGLWSTSISDTEYVQRLHYGSVESYVHPATVAAPAASPSGPRR